MSCLAAEGFKLSASIQVISNSTNLSAQECNHECTVLASVFSSLLQNGPNRIACICLTNLPSSLPPSNSCSLCNSPYDGSKLDLCGDGDLDRGFINALAMTAVSKPSIESPTVSTTETPSASILMPPSPSGSNVGLIVGLALLGLILCLMILALLLWRKRRTAIPPEASKNPEIASNDESIDVVVPVVPSPPPVAALPVADDKMMHSPSSTSSRSPSSAVFKATHAFRRLQKSKSISSTKSGGNASVYFDAQTDVPWMERDPTVDSFHSARDDLGSEFLTSTSPTPSPSSPLSPRVLNSVLGIKKTVGWKL
ncbi:hypothetical protein BDR26DRAFT_890770 [Obelidium mucronatum]|nr:hypothetical protein BDR26DRAFT_890770 [Obelidium mucronatum]